MLAINMSVISNLMVVRVHFRLWQLPKQFRTHCVSLQLEAMTVNWGFLSLVYFRRKFKEIGTAKILQRLTVHRMGESQESALTDV